MKRIFALVLALVMVAVVLAACGPVANELIMATNAEFPPFEFMDDDGNFAGFDVDIANEIADRLGKTLRIENMAFDAIITAVQSGPGNMIGVAAITINEERALAVNFTDAYFETELVVIVPADSEIGSNDDLDGRNVAVQLGTTSDLFATGSDFFGPENITRMPNPPNLILELNSGRVDAIIIDKEVALQFVNDNPGLMILDDEPIGSDNYGIAVQMGQDQLLADINNALAEMKADGTYDAIFAYWFGGDADNYYAYGYEDTYNDNGDENGNEEE